MDSRSARHLEEAWVYTTVNTGVNSTAQRYTGRMHRGRSMSYTVHKHDARTCVVVVCTTNLSAPITYHDYLPD